MTTRTAHADAERSIPSAVIRRLWDTSFKSLGVRQIVIGEGSVTMRIRGVRRMSHLVISTDRDADAYSVAGCAYESETRALRLVRGESGVSEGSLEAAIQAVTGRSA